MPAGDGIHSDQKAQCSGPNLDDRATYRYGSGGPSIRNEFKSGIRCAERQCRSVYDGHCRRLLGMNVLLFARGP